MSILSLISDLNLPGEEYWLQTRSLGDEENDDGDLIYEWSDVQEIYGVIQKSEEQPPSDFGDNEEGHYDGFFEPDFTIPYDQIGEYRVMHVFPGATEFIRYFKIRQIDRNLRLGSEYHHYEMKLELQRKWKDA